MANRTCLKGTHQLTQVLAIGVQVVQDTGNFVSKKDASVFPSVSTAETVKNVLQSSDQTFANDAIGKQANQIVVSQIQEFVENWQWRGFGRSSTVTNASEYATSLKGVFQNSTITDREIPIAISAIGVFDREQQKQQIKEIYADSEYVGELKKREKFFLKVIERRQPSTGGYLYKCITRERNLVHFFSKHEFAIPIEIGDCVLVNATVVEHKKSKYDHDNKTTRINRVTIIENYGQPKADSQPVSG